MNQSCTSPSIPIPQIYYFSSLPPPPVLDTCLPPPFPVLATLSISPLLPPPPPPPPSPSSLISSPSRLHSNNLQCDCHVAWLSEWLRQRPRLGLYTQCMAPPHLRGHNVAEVQKKEFVCTGRIGAPCLLFGLFRVCFPLVILQWQTHLCLVCFFPHHLLLMLVKIGTKASTLPPHDFIITPRNECLCTHQIFCRVHFQSELQTDKVTSVIFRESVSLSDPQTSVV